MSEHATRMTWGWPIAHPFGLNAPLRALEPPQATQRCDRVWWSEKTEEFVNQVQTSCATHLKLILVAEPVKGRATEARARPWWREEATGGHQQHAGVPPGDPPPVPGLPGGAEASGGSFRGLDSGLAKAAPNAHGLCQRNYRAYRRRLDLFSRQCLRRGREVAVEGALLVMSQLQDSAWDATEDGGHRLWWRGAGREPLRRHQADLGPAVPARGRGGAARKMPGVLRAVQERERRRTPGVHSAPPDHAAEAEGAPSGGAASSCGVAYAQSSRCASVDPPADQGPLRRRTECERSGKSHDKDVRRRQQAEPERLSLARCGRQHGRDLRGLLRVRWHGRGLLPDLELWLWRDLHGGLWGCGLHQRGGRATTAWAWWSPDRDGGGLHLLRGQPKEDARVGIGKRFLPNCGPRHGWQQWEGQERWWR